MGTTQMRRTAQPVHHDVEDSDEFYETRMPSSARRYQHSAPAIHHDTLDDPELMTPVTQRRRAVHPTTRYPQAEEEHITRTEALPHKQRFPLVAVLVGMVITILLFMTMGAIGSWWQGYQDDLHYGHTRTYHLDAVVGHHDSQANPTHFIFLNLRGHVEIIEIPGGDSSHMRVYTGPILYGDKGDLVPVTGEIRDVNHDGKDDLIVHIQNQQITFLNDGDTFKQQ
jgi:hypothetical protein